MQTPDSNQLATADYHASLLRLWREGERGPWRASLQDADSGERVGFADLERLFAYLLRLTDDAKSALPSLPQLEAGARECGNPPTSDRGEPGGR